MSSDYTESSDQPRRFCTRSRIVLCSIIVVVLFVYLASSNFSPFKTPVLISDQSMEIVFPTQTSTDSPPSMEIVFPTRTSTESLSLPHHFIGEEHLAPFSTPLPCEDPKQSFYNLLGNDTLIVIHIQKTGGSDFLRHLVTVQKNGHYLCQLPDNIIHRINRRQSLPKGKQRVKCFRHPSDPHSTQWLLSEKTMGWVCGVHPTYTEYKNCVPEIDTGTNSEFSQHRFMTILRHPVLRYLSEFEHVVRGAHWSVKKTCSGREVTESEMPPCYPGFYSGSVWPNVTLMDFMSCKSNWANNRQVMWLADLESAGCYDSSVKDRDKLLLSSAKCNLDKFAFFGITEYQNATSIMFEKVFNVTFSAPPVQYNISNLHTSPMLQDLWRRTEIYDKIAAINRLDMQLYEHALRLFARRAKTLGLTLDLQEVDHSVRAISNIDMSAGKLSKGRFDIPNNT